MTGAGAGLRADLVTGMIRGCMIGCGQGEGESMSLIVASSVPMEEVVEVTGVLSVDLGMTVAGSTAGSEDAEALDTGLVANMASTLLSSSALVSESEGEKEGKGMIWG
jgi:hypothetical protein